MRTLLKIVAGAVLALFAMAMVHATQAQSSGIPRAVRQQVVQSAVQLGPLLISTRGGKQTIGTIATGSGTVLSKDGVILTNNHVADVSDLVEPLRRKGVQVVEGVLVVSMTTRSDQPPTPRFIAKVVRTSPELDLAVLIPDKTLKGEVLDPATLDLPFVALGDSDEIDIGDALNIFGYPAIGGKTITFTNGPVSGFAAEGDVTRAWIKTSASISGGNSGGTAVDDAGKLVGVPTRGGTGEGPVTDCRPQNDTNGDGKVDQNDVCVPVGGFINSLRPVNLAIPLLTGEEQPQPVQDGVFISGQVVDARSGRPISGALFVVLKPGIQFTNALKEEDILESVTTDRNGNFATSEPLTRGERYSLGAVAKGFAPSVYNDQLIEDDLPAQLEVTIKLQPR